MQAPRRLVPGVLFCNRKFESARFGLIDVGMTALQYLQVPLPDTLGPKDARAWNVR